MISNLKCINYCIKTFSGRSIPISYYKCITFLDDHFLEVEFASYHWLVQDSIYCWRQCCTHSCHPNGYFVGGPVVVVAATSGLVHFRHAYPVGHHLHQD